MRTLRSTPSTQILVHKHLIQSALNQFLKMKKLPILTLLALSVFTLFNCKNDNKTVAAPVVEAPKAEVPPAPYQALPSLEGADKYQLSSGIVRWVGTTAVKKHNGILKIKDGTFHMKDGRLIGVKTTLDMTSINVEDIKDAGEQKDFNDHMKHADFFNASAFPTGSFEITDNLNNNATPDYPNVIIGNLTLKGIAKEVRIPVKAVVEGTKLKITTPGFAINRTDWGINYSSGIIGTAKDKLIDDYILLNIELEAAKQ
jgi:polyisoprenoid-binding protein YceI